MFRLFRTPSNRRKTVVFIGDVLLMLATIAFLVSFHTFAHRWGWLDIKRPLKSPLMYLCIPVHAVLGYMFEVYEIRRKERLRTFASLMVLSFLSFCFMFGLANVVRINQTTVAYMAVFFTISALSLYLWRLACARVLLNSRFLIKPKVLFIGRDVITGEILDEIKRRDYRILGLITDPAEDERTADGLRIVDTQSQLARAVHHHKPDILVTAINIQLPLNILKTIYRCKFSGCEVYESAYFYELITQKAAIKQYLTSATIPYLNVDAFARRHYGRIKSLADICIAWSALMLLWPVMLLVAVLIKATSAGPVFFTQERVGLHEKPFRLAKFRTMVVDAEQEGPQWSKPNDPRITRIGRFLRKTRLDELPQLINMCRGQMSLVGPRPIRRHMAELIEEHMPFYSLRFTAKPGLTGWAQVNYDYGGTVEGHVEKFQYDLYYLKHASALLDIFIILKTFQTVLRRPAC
ncbi:MAG: sugar transferase [Phycisphaerae bacterium]|nr:sugar transferase [Phycisphaerae bacterium]